MKAAFTVTLLAPPITFICELPDAGDGASPHTKENARLIAAAPGLEEEFARAKKSLAIAKIIPIATALATIPGFYLGIEKAIKIVRREDDD